MQGDSRFAHRGRILIFGDHTEGVLADRFRQGRPADARPFAQAAQHD